MYSLENKPLIPHISTVIAKYTSLSRIHIFLFPFSAIFLMRIRFREENAVSVAEKYADITMQTAIKISDIL